MNLKSFIYLVLAVLCLVAVYRGIQHQRKMLRIQAVEKYYRNLVYEKQFHPERHPMAD